MDSMRGRKQRDLCGRLVAAAFVALVLVCLRPTTTLAQCTLSGTLSTWNDGNSNWNNASNWSPIGVPNSSSTNVCITNGSSAVILDISATVDNLQLASGNSLTGDLGESLTVAGTQIINGGQIVINGGGGTNAALILDSSATLSGGGTLTLNTASGGGSAFIEQGVGGVTLTNANNTIEGNGIIGNGGLALVNQATINANVSGAALTLNGSGGITNTGVLEATNGGILNLQSVIVNNAGGSITAGTGSTVQITGNSDIQGGTLNNSGAFLGTPQGNAAYLDGSTGSGAVTINGTYTSDLNTETYLLGTITNKGNIQVNGGSATNSYLLLDSANVTLNGGGTVTLSTAGGGGSAFIEQAIGGTTLTNVNNTIQGSGTIGNGGMALNNGATINANVSAAALTLNGSGGITNTGVLEATNGGVLNLQSVTVNNAGGNITAGTGSTVQLFGSAYIEGGTLTNNGAAFFGTPQGGGAYLDGSTSAGAITLNGTYTSDLGSATVLFGTINNNNSIQLNGGNATNGELLMDEGTGSNAFVTLQGGGTVNLSTATGGGYAMINQQVGGMTLKNVNNTIQGEGIIGENGLTLLNESGGVVDANSTGGSLTTTLYLQQMSGGVANQGLLEATNNGVLQINGVTVDNTGGGRIQANGAGASVQLLGSAYIEGGTLTNNGGAFFGTPQGGGAYLDGSTSAGAITLNGTYTSDLGSATVLFGTINNNNSIQLNGGSGTNGQLLMDEGTGSNTVVTLQGGGTVTLSTTAKGGGYAILDQQVGGMTLENVNNTIQGEGIIGENGLTLLNEPAGVVNANSTGGSLINTLTLETMSGGLTNQGLLEATNNGILQLNGVTVNNAGGGQIQANGAGASVQLFDGADVQGGTLTNNGGAFFGTPTGYGAYLDGSTSAGPITLKGTYTSDFNTATYLLGTIINNNNFQLNGGGGTNSELIMGSNVTLEGGGTVTLNTAGGGGEAYVYQAAGGLTLENVNNLIQGNGEIGENGLTLLNDPAGVVNANLSGGTLLFANAAVTNKGLIEATNGAILQFSGVTVNNAGGNITANGSTVQFLNSADIQGGTLNNNGGFLGTPQGYVAILDGTTQGPITINGTYTSDFNTVTYLYGTLNNHGNLQLNGGAGTNSYLILGSNVTLEGGGALTLNNQAGGGVAEVYQAAGGTTLENVNNTIQGNGTIGVNGLSVLNDAGGTILANVSGGTLLMNGNGTLTNNGTLQVNDGSLLHVANVTFTNFSGNTLTGGTYIMNGPSLGATLEIDPLGNTGGEIVNNAANIILNGPASDLVDAAGLDALTNFNNNTAAGSFTIENGRNLTTTGNFSNAGTMTVGTAVADSSTLKIGPNGTNTYTQSAGMTQGTGTIAGKVTLSGGTIQPGLANTPGTLSINGSYNQTAGAFSEQMMGAAAGQFGVLNVSGGNLTLGSSADLSIALLSGFNPVGDQFDIINDTGGTISGTFANAPASGFQMDGYNWTIAYNAGQIILNGISQAGGLINATWSNTSSGNGHWTTATEWQCSPGPGNCVPNNNTSNVYAATLDNPGNTLTLDSSDTPSSITLNTLSLQAGTLNIGTGATLNLVNQPSGVTDIPSGAGLDVAGTFEVNGGPTSALAGLSSVEGTLTLEGQTITATPGTGTLSNTGTMNLQQTTALTITGSLTNSGAINLGNGLSDTGNNSLFVSGLLSNSGTIALNAAVDSLTADLTNSGAIKLAGTSETLTDTGDFTNNGPGVLEFVNTGSGDMATVAGNFNNQSGAWVEMDGSNGTLSVTGAFNNNGGYVSLAGSDDTLSALSFTNSGAVSIGGNETLTTTGGHPGFTYTQTAGSTTVNGTLKASASGVSLQGGSLLGAGTVNGDLDNTGGSVEPASAPGVASTLTVNGSYTQGLGGTLVIDLGPNFPISSLLEVFGNVTLDGTVDFDAVDGFTPTTGEDFTFLEWSGTESGNFANMQFSNWICPSGDTCTDVFGANSLTLEIASSGPPPPVPEPASLLLLGTGLLGLAGYCGARRSPRKS